MAQGKKQFAAPAYLQNWWAEPVLAIVLLAISYGFVSWAINSGSLVEYALGILFFASAIKTIVMAVRNVSNR